MAPRIVPVLPDHVGQYIGCRSPVFLPRLVGRLASHFHPQDCLDISRLVWSISAFSFLFVSVSVLVMIRQWAASSPADGFRPKTGHQMPSGCLSWVLSSKTSFYMDTCH
jgi:hypothetical protein